MSSASDIAATKDLLVKANRILANEGVVDDFGHVSARSPEDPGRYFISCAISPARVTAADIYEYELDGMPIADLEGRRSYSERAIHGAIYEARPDVMAVCHHHSGAMVAFASSTVPLRPIFHLGAVLGHEVPVWDSHTEFGDTSLLVDDMDKARSLARALGPHSVALLRRHGAVVAGASVKQVVFSAIYSADNATAQARMIAMGGDISYLTAGEIDQAAALNLSSAGIDRSWPNRCARAGLKAD